MKKLITLFTFVFASLVFANAGFAQKTSDKEIMEKTRTEVSEMGATLDLSTDQKDLMVRYLYAHNFNYDRNLKGQEKDKDYHQLKQKFDGELMISAKEVLKPSQFEDFKKLMKEKHGEQK